MFKPNSKAKKLLQAADRTMSAAYLYPDGVVIVEKQSVKAKGAKERNQVEVAHVYHCPIKFFTNANDDDLTCRRIVVYDPLMILHGVEFVDVYYHGGSKAMKKRDIDCVSVRLTTPDGGHVRDTMLPFLCSELAAQPTPVTVEAFANPYSEIWKTARTIDQWMEKEREFYFAVIDEQPASFEVYVEATSGVTA